MIFGRPNLQSDLLSIIINYHRKFSIENILTSCHNLLRRYVRCSRLNNSSSRVTTSPTSLCAVEFSARFMVREKKKKSLRKVPISWIRGFGHTPNAIAPVQNGLLAVAVWPFTGATPNASSAFETFGPASHQSGARFMINVARSPVVRWREGMMLRWKR